MESTRIFGRLQRTRHFQIGATKMTNFLTSDEIGSAANTVIKNRNDTTIKTLPVANKRMH